MTVRQVTFHADEPGRREFRRLLAISAVLHLAGFIAMAATPMLPRVSAPSAISVNLVAAPTLSASPAPAAARPKPKPPKPAPVVLPTQPSVPKPQPRPEPKPKPEPLPPQPEAPPEEEYADVMAQLRNELGEPAEEPQTEPATAPAAALPGGGGGAGAIVSPEVAAWLRDARVHVRRNWTLTGNFRMQSLTTAVEIDLDAAGNVRGTPSIERRSGNPWYDEGVVRSIQKASPLPAPPDAGRWTFVFVSDEDY